VVQGAVTCEGLPLRTGDFALVPACLTARERGVRTENGAVLLKTSFGGTR